MVDETDRAETDAAATDTEFRTTRRMQTLAIFLIGIGVYAVGGAKLDQAALLANNTTTYVVSGLVILGVGLLLALLTRL